MNILNRLTLNTLRQNKTRTLVTIIGVILATAMITAVTTLIASLRGYMVATSIDRYGDWHGAAFNLSFAGLEELQASSEISKAIALENLGYARLEESRNEYMPYLFVAGFPDELYETLAVKPSLGRLPQNDTEILLPEHLAYNGGVEYKLGHNLQLALGKRMVVEGGDRSPGRELSQQDSYLRDGEEATEKLVLGDTRSYTIVGFYERPHFETRSAPGYTAITSSGSSGHGHGDSYDCYFKLKAPGKIYSFTESLFGESGWQSWRSNNDLLRYMGVSHHRNFTVVLYSFAAILVGLIMFGSISLIYNAFAISVSERSKQFGLLASVGATRAQLRRSVYFEALLVSSLGIPIGLLSGLAGIGITLYCVGDKIDLMGSGLPFAMIVSWPALLAATILTLMTVLIAASIPARRANRLSPLVAIRQIQDIKAGPKQIKTGPLTAWLFGFSGLMARRNFKRHRRKHRSTIVSLTLSIVLFVSATAYTGYLKHATGVVYNLPAYDISFTAALRQTTLAEMKHIYTEMAGLEGVEASINYVYLHASTNVEDKHLNPKLVGESPTDQRFGCEIVFLPEPLWIEFTKSIGLDVAGLASSPSIQAVINDQVTWYDGEEDRYLLESLFLPQKPVELTLQLQEEGKPLAVEVAAVTNKMPFKPRYQGIYLRLFLPENKLDAFGEPAQYALMEMGFNAKNHSSVHDKMQEVLVAQGFSLGTLHNHAQAAADERNIILILDVFSYGFISLISLIAVANVFNTIYTNIQLRRREFAMLKSVGMGPAQFNSMMFYECGFYGVQALLYGLPLAYGVTYMIYRAARSGVAIDFSLPLGSSLVVASAVFIIVFVTNTYAIRDIKNENIADALTVEAL